MSALSVKWLGVQDYESTWESMRKFTDSRDASIGDELWLLEHPAVFTLGQAGKEHHLLNPGEIPIVRTDRGGQVTYHGPGQLVGYFLVDIKRKKLGIREMVTGIEQSVIRYLDEQGIDAFPKQGAPGVYVDDRKISALGLRIRKGCSYHGFSLNVDMDLSVFHRINPCGYEGLEVTDLASLGIQETPRSVGESLAQIITYQFGYDSHPAN